MVKFNNLYDVINTSILDIIKQYNIIEYVTQKSIKNGVNYAIKKLYQLDFISTVIDNEQTITIISDVINVDYDKISNCLHYDFMIYTSNSFGDIITSNINILKIDNLLDESLDLEFE